MNIDIGMRQILFIVVFVAMFMGIGWIAPAMYTSYAPQDHLFEVHEMETQNASIGEDSHNLCLDRTIKRPGNSVNNIEILRTNPDGTISKSPVYIWGNEGYFERGHAVVEMEFPLPTDLEKGKYVYKITATFTYNSGRVERTFLVTSEPFWIKEDPTAGSNWECS